MENSSGSKNHQYGLPVVTKVRDFVREFLIFGFFKAFFLFCCFGAMPAAGFSTRGYANAYAFLPPTPNWL